MQIIRDLKEITQPFFNAVVTVGNFDGVHLGHQALMQKAKERARLIGGTAVVFTFEPHPVKVLKGRHLPVITPFERKMELIAEQGIDVVVCPPFTKEFARIGPKEFICDILIKKIGMKEMVVGYDFAFGREREGNIAFLQDLAGQLGYELHVLGPVVIDGLVVSSTKVRELIMAGEMEKVKRLLGRYYQVRGTVIKGRNRGGRLLGVPTANLKLINEVFPKNGVYAVEVIYQDEKYPGVANIGFNPTFGDQALSVETHIIDFNKDIYGETISVNFIKRLRDEKRFESIDELKTQIQKDIKEALKVLNA